MKRTKTEEPKIACPVCQAQTKLSNLNTEGNAMCNFCANFLRNPNVDGTDHGTFMTAIEVDDSPSMFRTLHARPRGFWSDVIMVRERQNTWNKTITVDVTWSMGGQDGSLDGLTAAVNFAGALNHAVEVARKWQAERKAVTT